MFTPSCVCASQQKRETMFDLKLIWFYRVPIRKQLCCGRTFVYYKLLFTFYMDGFILMIKMFPCNHLYFFYTVALLHMVTGFDLAVCTRDERRN